MEIYLGLDRDCMSLYEIYINLNHFAVILHILIHVIICVTDIQIMNDSRYNTQLNIWYSYKISYHVEPHRFWNFYKIISYDQSLCIWV